MKYKSVLNNYQLGSYSYNLYKNKVISVERIDSKHTEVIWELNTSEYNLLNKVVKHLIKLERKDVNEM